MQASPDGALAPGPQVPVPTPAPPVQPAGSTIDNDAVTATPLAVPNAEEKEDDAVVEEMVLDPHIYVQGWSTPASHHPSSGAGSRRSSLWQPPMQPRRSLVAPPLRDIEWARAQLKKDQAQWAQETRELMKKDLQEIVATTIAQTLASQAAEAAQSSGPFFRKPNDTIDIATLLQRDQMSQTYVAARRGVKRRTIECEESEDEAETAAPSHQRRPTQTFVMAATEHVARQGRWIPPKDIPLLTEHVDDIDWWFHRMQLHLNNCRIVNQQERVDCLHTHTEDGFHQRVWQRCDAEKVARADMYRSEDAYRVFVADRFGRATAMQRLQRKLDALAGKDLPPIKAWDEVYRLAFCYNEKAKRKSRPLLSQQDITRHFISALPLRIRDCMRSMILHDHPMIYDASHALTVATQYEEEKELERGGRDDSDIEAKGDGQDDQSAMLASRRRPNGKRSRRGDAQARKDKAHQIPVSGGQGATSGSGAVSPAFAVLQHSSPAGAATNTETRTCYKCKQQGHLKRDCPMLRQERGDQFGGKPPQRHIPYQKQDTAATGQVVCSYCGRTGHTAEMCWIAVVIEHHAPQQQLPQNRRNNSHTNSATTATR